MTELIWDGKYQDGKKVAPPRIALPFQTVETVNESAAERFRTASLFNDGKQTEWRNRLIWGDKKYVLPSLLPEFAGKINLIYIDPPFDTGANFSYMATVPDDPDAEGNQSASFVKEPSVIEQKAYRDTWGKGLDSYLKWFYETVVMLRELLADDGCIYVHLDWHVGHYAKTVLDEVFGSDNFINDIIWKRSDSHSDSQNKYSIVKDSVFFYCKGTKRTWNPPYIPLSEKTADSWYKHIDSDTGRRYNLADCSSPNPRPNMMYTYKGVKHPPNGWRYSQERMKELDESKKLHITPTTIKLKRYLDESKGVLVSDIWLDISQIRGYGATDEAIDYSTQKPEALLERVINASSNTGDLILDCFCGSGTTAAVAEKLGRRWITCDLGRYAIHTARKRLLGIEGVKPFVVQNLGKYERQAWHVAEFGENADAQMQAYRKFILSLYKAQPISGYVWLHGVKSGRMVHVGSVDAPISVGDVTQIATEFRRAIGSGKDAPTQSSVDILGWDFAFELNEVAKQQAALAGIDVRFVKIPREVLEKKAVEQGDIKFFELAALSVDILQSGRGVTLKLTDFVIPLDDVPDDVRKAITHWEQWVDYWAIDWDNKGDTFHNEWQAYRTRKDKSLQKQIAKTYDAAGEYKIVVKVIDILGNDTTKTLKVKVS